jgi:hypothetical protein
MISGYARVSTTEQNFDSQRDAQSACLRIRSRCLPVWPEVVNHPDPLPARRGEGAVKRLIALVKLSSIAPHAEFADTFSS